MGAGHAPGATHLPLGQVADQVRRVPKCPPVTVACRSGHRASRATALLLRSGIDAVNLDGGMLAWGAAGFPVEDANGGLGTVV